MKVLFEKIREKYSSLTIAVIFSIFIAGCGDYEAYDNPNGKLAVLQQANLFLNSAMCEQAISILTPLYWSSQVDEDVRMTLASAYACKANFSFPTVLGSVKTGGSDIYTLLVKAMYSNGNDSHLTNFQSAAQYVRETSKVAGNMAAANRSSDANIYMIFIQGGIIASVISTLGVANQTTGKKTQAVVGAAGTAAQKCAIQVAFATISDCISAVGSVGSLGSLSSSVSSICSVAGCTNLDTATCEGSAALQLVGATILDAINLQWI